MQVIWFFKSIFRLPLSDYIVDRGMVVSCLADVRYLPQSLQNIAGPHVVIDTEAEIGFPTATKAMMAGYASDSS